ncbi:hypothetical protein [Stenomitos frigidus]|uniref:Uncharacterized protein n=1 Tax=Stenomitos frigidus ULC18 TaxID=2107698 RepID=A0A2T1E1F4_9CYAN|nr:hypothetical protein [Stenomitos frigidus]PSB26586.1 hypothetical protein C7B82_19400 [Stenomitos frigidus ULC18]
MLSPTRSQSPVNQLGLTPKILESRDQYRSCHICLPEEDYRTAAIKVSGKYYGLVKVVQDRERSLEIGKRLTSVGTEAVITQLAKGYAIWRLETEAYVDSCPRSPSQALPILTEATLCRILESRSEYKACHISLSDSDQRLAAVLVDGNYYGLLKVVTTQQQALTLASRLQRKEVEAVITKAAQGYAVWFLEPNAVVFKD